MNGNYGKFRRLLEELFQLDHADLDFGIYRIMNQKRDEIMRFLDNDLLPQVQEAFREYQGGGRANIEAQLIETIQQIKSLGMDPETSSRVKELREQLSEAVDVTKLENEVFSDLYDFFRRYYSEGDFLSLRRYKEGVYAIPYEGEEVKLHWANHDQYYVKTSEYFRDYTFKLPSGKRVHFKLVEADTEKDNQKAEAGKERRFVLCEEDPLAEVDGELHIRFEYRPDPDKSKQDALNNAAFETIMNRPGFSGWKADLAQPMPTPANPNRTLLEKHLSDYTARNTFDYFIHKDLGGFLRRELDFYIKNEIMHLDDIENESAPRVDQYLSKIKVIRKVAHKIIRFLAQIEDFQKKLWLKKKFVVEANYCVTLDRVPEELWDEILENESQTKEWQELFSLNGMLEQDGLFNNGLDKEFLRRHPRLILDTKHFSDDFRYHLLEHYDDLDQAIDGMLIKSENWQALRLLQERYRGQIKCAYIDPPYNTGSDDFIYKDNYQYSSWLSMMSDRLLLARDLLRNDGVILVSIGDHELHELRSLMNNLFGGKSFVSTFIWNTEGHTDNQYEVKVNHEYILSFARQERKGLLGYVIDPNTREESNLWRGIAENSITKNGSGNPPSEVTLPKGFPCKADSLDLLPTDISDGFYEEIERQGYITREMTRRYQITYPIRFDRMVVRNNILAEPCRVYSGWANVNKLRRFIDIGLAPISEADGDISFYLSENGVIYYKKKGERARNILSVLRNMGTTEKMRYELEHMGLHYLYPRPKELIQYIIQVGSEKSDTVLDFFAGSGTTGHAVVSLNNQNDDRRKYIMVEMDHSCFGTLLLPRMKKLVFSDNWENGKPISNQGNSHMLKYVRLESYEDTLNNLELKRAKEQESLLAESDSFRESYMLSYMLNVESNDSPSLLNVDAFEAPFNCKLKITTGSAGETKPVAVDLVETFNYLLGLTVRHIDHIRGFRVFQGTSPQDEKVLVIWRNLKEKSNEDLEEFFRKQEYNPRDMEFDLIYVNGDNNLENIRRPDETWKVRLIEEDFKRLMFEVEDV